MAKMASGDLSLTSTSSQEEESSEYAGYDNTLRPPSNSSGSTTAANMANNNGPTKAVNNVGGGGGVGGNGKKYELLQSQYESAMCDLNTLRHQHSNSERRCDELATQLNLYQEHYMADRNKYTDIVAESARLKHKLMLLENQNQNNGNPSASQSSTPGSNAFYYGKMQTPCDGSCNSSEKLAELKKERNLIAMEREKYKKSYIELEKERNFYRERGEENQTLKVLLSKETKHVVSLTEELNQLLSEKDNVLQEHQKMSDDLALANKEIDRLKKDELVYKSELKSLQLANAEHKKRDLLKSRESSWSKEFSNDSKEELEKLRKSLDKAQSEVERALQDAEEAKRVRDWAISQREKIVQERDSVKTLCDNLRKERDKAISDLLMAIRDSEKIKKQKDEAQKKIDALKEQLESQTISTPATPFDSASRRSFRLSSFESGEDLLEIELCNYHDSDLGIILDDSNKRQLVCGVTNSSSAFGKLKINDVICKVNNLECQGLSKRMVLDEIRACAPRCLLLVSRTRHSKRHSYAVQLKNNGRDAIGLQLDMGVFIAKIEPNSLAFYEPELDVGDRVLSINNKSMDSLQSIDEVMQLLNTDTVNIFALKYVPEQQSDAHCRMTSSSAQTDSSIDSMQQLNSSSGVASGSGSGGGSGAAKHPSKFADFLRKLKFSKPGTADDSFEQEHDVAIAALDSVLSENSSEKSKENLFKRHKRGKKGEKEAKSMGTWPRTNISHENPTGTIVQRGGEKKRALMSLFTAGPINVDKDDDVVEQTESKPPMQLQELPPPPLPPQLSKPRNLNGGAIKTHPNRNSNPVSNVASTLFQPGNVGVTYPRHSLYGGVVPTSPEDKQSPMQRPAPLMGANARVKLHGQERSIRSHNPHRFSLNIPPSGGDFYQPKTSGQQAQQQVVPAVAAGEFPTRKQQMFDMFQQPAPPLPLPLPKVNATFMPVHPPPRVSGGSGSAGSSSGGPVDIISLKSQNSIESMLSAKSPPISESNVYRKRNVPPMPPKHVPKYPSDSESIGSGILVSGGHNYLPSHQAHMATVGNRHTQLFPSFQPSSHGQRYMRRSSPLTLPSPPPSTMASILQAPQAAQLENTSNNSTIGIPTDLDFVPGQHTQQQQQQQHPHPHQHLQHPPYIDYSQPQSHYPYSLAGVVGSGNGVIYEGGTFPRKKDNQRLRIPSNPSVASNRQNSSSLVKNSSGSIDHHYATSGSTGVPVSLMSSSLHTNYAGNVSSINGGVAGGGGGGGSGRGSPMPQVHVEVLSHGGPSGSGKRNSNVASDFLCPGDLRRVTIDKRDKSLGITIQCNNNGGGIFVSTVADKSTAMRAGLQVGDQLLEVCGINMRAATNEIAANVLRQCGDSFTMLVQYNPEKFHSTEYEGIHNLEPESPLNHSGSPTPRNSPRPPARSVQTTLPMQPLSLLPSAVSVTRAPLSHQSIKDQSFTDSLENQSDISSSQDMPSSAATTTTTTASATSTVYDEDTKISLPSAATSVSTEGLRFVTLHMDKSKNLGIKLFGGNKVGIYVHDVAPGSPSDHAGIRKGDLILEYNGVDLSGVTAEQAANEISKLTDTVTMLVQNKLQTLKQIKDKPGDSFYIRVGFDRVGELNEEDLRFIKDEVLYVDNTVFNGTFGLWRAWKLDAMGHRKECGVIPSQMKVEEELRSGEVVDCDTGTARRGSTSARRSFFRRKKNQRSSSRDSTEIASFSNTQLSFFPDSGILNDDGGVLSYQRVELLDSPIRRPVLIIGPLSECLIDRLKIDFSNLFKLCEVTTMDCSQEAMEEGLKENIFVDYRRRGNKFECTTVEAISNACKIDRRHCILDVSISAVERLQRLQIYPIVLLLRFKSAKQIRDIRDFGTDKISAKAAKEMYERALKLEFDYKQYISAVIPGVSIKHMCTQIKDAVDKEQDKLLWVPVTNG
ncbi:PREDICTED: disks large homolog 5 [Drosophila arizonae]|uniref:Disks large homolog 5 n=1 Tax=Drosophila arizonae TaxID=7263 RepID=A0ABM1NXH7_DROAR|nr:PREDICTED: disks large homolog 5 [Drosophila arizonae]XP_017859663.1 PREDICTED: disks large homolog 5 [Drosophila arizonae]